MVQVPIYFLTAAGLVLFFMVSGALLLPVHGGTKQWLHRRMGKILGPTLFWTLFYLTVAYLANGKDDGQLFRDLISIPFTAKGHGVLWFMYTLAGLYLLAPIVSPWLKQASRNELRIYLGLWGVSLFLPWVALVADVNTSATGMLYYFSGYAGYFILGFYLHTHGSRLPSWGLVTCLVVPICCLLIFGALGGKGLEPLFWYLSIFVAAMALAWFEGVRRLSLVNKMGGGVLTELSNCSFGIYLVHIFIMRYGLWNIDFIVHGLGWLWQIVVTWVLTLVISFLLTKAMSYFPFSEYIIGYHSGRLKNAKGSDFSIL